MESIESVTTDIKFAIVPEWFIDSGVSDKAFRLYTVLAKYADNDSGTAYPGRGALAKRMGCSRSSVDRALEELIAIGAVSKQRRSQDGRWTSSLYTVYKVGPRLTGGGSPTHATTPSPTDATTSSHPRRKELDQELDQRELSIAATPREEAKPKAPRPEDPLWNAMLAACGIDGKTITKTGRGQVNAALKELREIGATPADIDAKAKVYRKTWPDASLTPSALVKHWAALATKAEQVRRTCECGQPLDNHSDEVHDILMRGGL